MPVKRAGCRLQRCARRQIESHVEARRARIIGERRAPAIRRSRSARLAASRTSRSKSTIMLRASPRPNWPAQRLRDACRNLLRGDGAAGARDDHFGKPRVSMSIELVRTDRLDDAFGRHRAAGAEIGRAEDRHVGDRAGIVDQVADAHDVARDGDACLATPASAPRQDRRAAPPERKIESRKRGCRRGSSAWTFLSASVARSSAASRRQR